MRHSNIRCKWHKNGNFAVWSSEDNLVLLTITNVTVFLDDHPLEDELGESNETIKEEE